MRVYCTKFWRQKLQSCNYLRAADGKICIVIVNINKKVLKISQLRPADRLLAPKTQCAPEQCFEFDIPTLECHELFEWAVRSIQKCSTFIYISFPA